MLLAERAGRKLEPWSNSLPRGMAVITGEFARIVVTKSGLSAYFISYLQLRQTDRLAAAVLQRFSNCISIPSRQYGDGLRIAYGMFADATPHGATFI